jgi:chaperonin GroES
MVEQNLRPVPTETNDIECIDMLGDQILVLPYDVGELTQNGIILPHNSRSSVPARGTVIVAGMGVLVESGDRLPLSVCDGDEILYRRDSAIEMTVDGQVYLYMHERDVLGVIRKETLRSLD